LIKLCEFLKRDVRLSTLNAVKLKRIYGDTLLFFVSMSFNEKNWKLLQQGFMLTLLNIFLVKNNAKILKNMTYSNVK